MAQETVCQKAIVMFSYNPQESDEITLKVGEVVSMVDKKDAGWCEVETTEGKRGLYPDNYLTVIENDKKFPETLIIVDLESTGLGGGARITEFAMVVLSRKEFTERVPARAISTFSVCVNPCKAVSLDATIITGLDNWMLEHQPRFTKDMAESILKFIQQFRPPLCFIAHNGNCFDFRLIRAEFNKAGVEIPDDILCGDSLPAFRYLDRDPPSVKKRKIAANPQKLSGDAREKDLSCQADESLKAKDVFWDDAEFIELLNQVPENLYDDAPALSPAFKTPTNHFVPDKEQDLKKESETGIVTTVITNGRLDGSPYIPVRAEKSLQEELEKTPTRHGCRNSLETSERLPKTAKTRVAVFDSSTPKRNKKSSARKSLFESDKKTRLSYKLVDVYERLVGSPPSAAHRALDDCFSLLSACQSYPEFLVWLDAHCCPIKTKSLMW